MSISEDPFAVFTSRQQVYDRAGMTLSQLTFVPFHQLTMGEQYHINDDAESLISLSLSYMNRYGETEGYKCCASTREQVAYCVCLKYGNRWDRIERLAPWLHKFSHWQRFGRHDGEQFPEYPFND